MAHTHGTCMRATPIEMHVVCRAGDLKEEVGAATYEVDHGWEEVHLATDGGVLDVLHEEDTDVVKEAVGPIPYLSLRGPRDCSSTAAS